MLGCASLFALALALAACSGNDAGEDAPALLDTGIPAAAPDARGVQLDLPAADPGAALRFVQPPDPVQTPADPFGTPDPFETPDPPDPPALPHPIVPGKPPSKGMQL